MRFLVPRTARLQAERSIANERLAAGNRRNAGDTEEHDGRNDSLKVVIGPGQSSRAVEYGDVRES